MTHHLILDYDGVIADTWEIGIRALVDLGIRKNLDDARAFRINHFSHRPTHLHTTGNDQTAEKEILIRRTNQMTDYFVQKGYALFDGFVDELKKIPDAKMAIVSSGAQKSVIPYTKKTGLPFTHVLCLEDSLSKEWKIRKVVSDWDIGVNDILYITDTLSDVYELETFMPKKHIIGCAWGYLGYDALHKELPDAQIMKTFRDIHTVLSHY